MYSKKMIVVSNTDWFFLLHRISIANSLKDDGYDVIVATKDTGSREEIIRRGFAFVDVNFDRKGMNFLEEIKVLYDLYKIYSELKPIIIYQVTIKPIIYGSIIARLLKINTVNTICGLGYVFSKKKKSLLRKVISKAYSSAVNYKRAYTFFENKDDQNTFLKSGILRDKIFSTVVNGAGVDLDKFQPKRDSNINGKIVITLATRMLWDKGVKEFVESAKFLENAYKNKIEFRLFGMIDKGNPESVPEVYLNKIEIKEYIKWFGFVDDMVTVYENSDIVVLPSYYGEGLPTVLAEACTMGLPIITTDSVGCRECVVDGVNGYMIPIKSIEKLVEAISKLIKNNDLRLRMGKASRQKAILDFDQKKIVAQYRKVFNEIIERD